MQHERHYTLAEANAIRGWVAGRVRRIQQASSELAALGHRADQALAALEEQTGGAFPGPEAARPLLDLSLALGELDTVEVVLRDENRGLVDFPAMRNGDEVYVCSLLDGDEAGFCDRPECRCWGR